MNSSFLKILVAFLGVSAVSSFALLPSARQSSFVLYSVSEQQPATVSEYSVVVPEPAVEYAALSPGCAVEIQVGNVTLARKAWKKRRRSGSPLLVPCSILSIPQGKMIQWNLLYLLQKFGKSVKEQQEYLGFRNPNDVCISTTDIQHYYQRHLGTSLMNHAKALGHDNVESLVKSLFGRAVQKDLGVRLWVPPPKENDIDEADNDDKGSPIWLMAPISKRRAHRMAAQASLLQFRSPLAIAETSSDDETTSNIQMNHTGIFKIRNDKKLLILPLSAALRVSQSMLNQGVISENSTHKAIVLGLDETGDGGSPLLLLSLNPTRQLETNQMKLKAAAKKHYSHSRRLPQVVGDIQYQLSDLRVGQGPVKAKVMSLSERSGAAFVDCGVARKNGETRVLGMLRFDDLVQTALQQTDNDKSKTESSSVMSDEEEQLIEDAMYGDDDDWEEEDDDGARTVEDLFVFDDNVEFDGEDTNNEYETEEEMDITHLVSTKDGVMSYKDPETGESVVISDESLDGDEDFDEDDDDEEEDDLFVNMSPEERLEMISNIMNEREQSVDVETEEDEADEKAIDEVDSTVTPTDSYQPTFLKVGDEIEVYIKSVYKQSGRFMVTLDSSVQGRKAKDLKKESEAEKRLARLAEKMGGLERIRQLEGTECDGIVQAISNTGDWCYVKPSMEDLPVGVAKLSSKEIEVSKGDTVQVRLDGIDESRGQLAMTVI